MRLGRQNKLTTETYSQGELDNCLKFTISHVAIAHSNDVEKLFKRQCLTLKDKLSYTRWYELQDSNAIHMNIY